MNTPTLTNTGPGEFTLSGDLDFATVDQIFREGERQFPAHPLVRIDMAAVGKANSAGLALLLEWVDRARRRDQRMEILHLPDSLARLAAITNLAGLLPLGADTGAPQRP